MSEGMHCGKLRTATVNLLTYTRHIIQVQYMLVHVARAHGRVAQPHPFVETHVEIFSKTDRGKDDFPTGFTLLTRAIMEDLETEHRLKKRTIEINLS